MRERKSRSGCNCAGFEEAAVLGLIGYVPVDLDAFNATLPFPLTTDLLEVALTHKSWSIRHGGESNQRLEWLGDSVMRGAVAKALFERLPSEPEGVLSSVTATLLANRALAAIAVRLGIPPLIRVDTYMYPAGGAALPPKMHADAYEALIGAAACVLDPDRTDVFVHTLMQPDIDAAVAGAYEHVNDPRTELNRILYKTRGSVPEWTITEHGDGVDRYYTAEAILGDEVVAAGDGPNRKAAARHAAEAAVLAFKIEHGITLAQLLA